MNRKQHNDAFLEWVLSYDSVLWHVARTYAQFGEHEHLHQDILIALWHAVPHYRDEAKPSTFIYRVALNCALNWTRSRQRYQQRHVDVDLVQSQLPTIPAQTTSGEQERRVEQLYAALATLTEADRSIALLYLDDLSYREIGEILGISESNVGVKLNRVKKRLSDCLRQSEQQGKGRTK